MMKITKETKFIIPRLYTDSEPGTLVERVVSEDRYIDYIGNYIYDKPVNLAYIPIYSIESLADNIRGDIYNTAMGEYYPDIILVEHAHGSIYILKDRMQLCKKSTFKKLSKAGMNIEYAWRYFLAQAVYLNKPLFLKYLLSLQSDHLEKSSVANMDAVVIKLMGYAAMHDYYTIFHYLNKQILSLWNWTGGGSILLQKKYASMMSDACKYGSISIILYLIKHELAYITPECISTVSSSLILSDARRCGITEIYESKRNKLLQEKKGGILENEKDITQ